MKTGVAGGRRKREEEGGNGERREKECREKGRKGVEREKVESREEDVVCLLPWMKIEPSTAEPSKSQGHPAKTRISLCICVV